MTHLSSPDAHAPDADAYVGRHRSHRRQPRPLPMSQLSGATDVAVGVNLTAVDPHVILTSDWDQTVITLTRAQRRVILTSAQSAIEYDYSPSDADLDRVGTGGGWDERNERTMRVVRGLASGEL